MFVQMVVPSFLCLLPSLLVDTLIYPAYNQANEDGKLLIAVFAPPNRCYRYAPINVNPVGGSAGKGWGFDKF